MLQPLWWLFKTHCVKLHADTHSESNITRTQLVCLEAEKGAIAAIVKHLGLTLRWGAWQELKTHFYVTIPQLHVFYTQLLAHSLLALSLTHTHDKQRCNNQSFFILQTWVDSTSNSKNWLTYVTVGRLGYNKTVGWKLWANDFWSSVCPHSCPLAKKKTHSARI